MKNSPSIHCTQIEYNTRKRRYVHTDCETNDDYVEGITGGIIKMNAAILVVSVTDGRVCRIHTKQNLEFCVIEHTTMRIQIKSTYIQHTLRSAEFCSEFYSITCSSLIQLDPFHKLNP